MKNRPSDPEKYPTLSEKDEDIIKLGITKAETDPDLESISSSSSSHLDTAKEDQENPIDESTFTPTRVFYILRHNLFSKEVDIIDITNQVHVPYIGGEISDDLRNAARGLSEDKARTANPIYQLKRKHFYNSELKMAGSDGTELATWKHGHASFCKAQLTFPEDSKHSSHPITMKPTKWFRRTNTWVRNSVTYTWRCNSKYKANRMTLLKQGAGKQIVVARYAQRWGSWITGGVLLVDAKEEDEVIACLSACVMLKRMQQRAAERTRYGGGGGGGGGGE